MKGVTAVMKRKESFEEKSNKNSQSSEKLDTLPSLAESRPKYVIPPSQKPKRYSISELKSDMRRASVSSISSNSGRRPSISGVGTPGKRFKSIGNKVTNMLKVKLAFQKKGGGQEEDNSPIIKITELPKEPRFCSTLSPEAQVAMMKGYEDTVYSYICRSYPEYKFLLRRSRTPVSVPKYSEKLYDFRSVPSTSRDTFDGDGFGDEDEIDGKQIALKGSNLGRSVSTSPRPKSRNKERPTYDSRLNYSSGLSRSNSLPVLFPRERQLILTYRLQSAMDILDTVRCRMGLQPLSPRMKSYTSEIKPVTDFNKWTTVWSREFQDAPKSTLAKS